MWNSINIYFFHQDITDLQSILLLISFFPQSNVEYIDFHLNHKHIHYHNNVPFHSHFSFLSLSLSNQLLCHHNKFHLQMDNNHMYLNNSLLSSFSFLSYQRNKPFFNEQHVVWSGHEFPSKRILNWLTKNIQWRESNQDKWLLKEMIQLISIKRSLMKSFHSIELSLIKELIQIHHDHISFHPNHIHMTMDNNDFHQNNKPCHSILFLFLLSNKSLTALCPGQHPSSFEQHVDDELHIAQIK